jgi:hypothetical protein
VPAIYLDADVPLELERVLAGLGYTSSHARRTPHMSAASDGHQLLYAAQRNATLVTHNRKDFLLLHDAWQRWSRAWGVRESHAGILVISQSRTMAEPGKAIDELLSRTLVSNELYELVWRTGWRHHALRP